MNKEKLIQETKNLLTGKTCEFCGFRFLDTCSIKNNMAIDLNGSCENWKSWKKLRPITTVQEILDREG